MPHTLKLGNIMGVKIGPDLGLAGKLISYVIYCIVR